MPSFKNLIVILFIVGIVIVTRELTKRTFECPSQKEIIKWIPNPNQIALEDYNRIDEIFGSMFMQSEPWIGTSRVQSNKFRKLMEKNNQSENDEM
jgi:hypothetical protein